MKRARMRLAAALIPAALLALPAIAAAQETTDGAGNAEDDNTIGALAILLLFLLFAAIFIGICAAIFFLFRYVIRRNKERDAAMQAYAQERGLVFEGNVPLPKVTPLLESPGRSYGTVSGELAEGLVGRLGNYQYSTGSGDNRKTYFYAVVLGQLPEAGGARFYCYRRTVNDLFDSIGDALSDLQTVDVESERFNESFQLMVKDEANMVAIRQLFSPSFIVLLTEQVPDGFWFEIENGTLVGAIEGEHWETPADLDALSAATGKVAAWIRKDLAERADLRAAIEPPPPPVPKRPPPPPPQPS